MPMMGKVSTPDVPAPASVVFGPTSPIPSERVFLRDRGLCRRSRLLEAVLLLAMRAGIVSARRRCLVKGINKKEVLWESIAYRSSMCAFAMRHANFACKFRVVGGTTAPSGEIWNDECRARPGMA
jgi:hypothetical protein